MAEARPSTIPRFGRGRAWLAGARRGRVRGPFQGSRGINRQVVLTDGIAIFAAGVGAGVVNAVAGGGTLLSFPVLLWAGRDPIVANATNALALWPGALAGAVGFRRELAKAPRLLGLLLPPALVGGLIGGWLLLRTGSRVFSEVVPYLVLVATLL